MTKAELVDGIARDAGVKKTEAEKVLASIIANVTVELQKGESINLWGLGVFSTSARAARKGRNPRTGEEMDIPAAKVVKFKPAKALKDFIN
ncbi:MAG: HU family DNA-binding protein [Pseudomonadota bacterium]